MNSSDMAASIMGFTLFSATAWVIWAVVNNRRRVKVAETQAQMHTKLLEKFGSSQEMIAYLNSEAGAKFLDSASIEQAKPFGRVLGSVQAGLILFLLGIAMLFVRFTMPSVGWNAVEQAQTAHGFLAFSFLLLALGLGFLASAAVSYRLSKKWGLLDRELGSKR